MKTTITVKGMKLSSRAKESIVGRLEEVELKLQKDPEPKAAFDLATQIRKFVLMED